MIDFIQTQDLQHGLSAPPGFESKTWADCKKSIDVAIREERMEFELQRLNPVSRVSNTDLENWVTNDQNNKFAHKFDDNEDFPSLDEENNDFELNNFTE